MNSITVPTPTSLTPALQRLQHELNLQLDFIDNSCYLYDRGHIEDALRIAPAVAAILYPDLRLNYISLANRLLKNNGDSLRLFSTNRINLSVREAIYDKSAVLLLLGRFEDGYFSPLLDEDGSPNPFQGEMSVLDWLDQPIIYFHYQHKFHVYTREHVIRLGLGKFAPVLLPDYLKQDFFLRHPYAYVIKLGKASITLMDIFTASLRQIGYELLNSPALMEMIGTTVAIN